MNVRYWIYWNDLVQGPFEPKELASLHAFTADLQVCEENGQEWTPAAAVVDLLPYFQAIVTPYVPLAAPPPPPPSEPPRIVPLQGEFFSESVGQQTLFDQNGSKNYLFRPASEEAGNAAEELLPPLTTPFRFVYRRPDPKPVLPHWAPLPDLPPVPKLDPEIRVEVELGILEPEEMIVLEPPVESPKAPYAPPPKMPEKAVEAPSVATPIFSPPPLPVVQPQPRKRIEREPIKPSPLPVSEPKALEPPVVQKPALPPQEDIPAPPETPRERPVPAVPPSRFHPAPRVAIPDFTPRQSGTGDAADRSEKPRLWPWIAGVSAAAGFIGLLGFGLLGRTPTAPLLKSEPSLAEPAVAVIPPTVESTPVSPERLPVAEPPPTPEPARIAEPVALPPAPPRKIVKPTKKRALKPAPVVKTVVAPPVASAEAPPAPSLMPAVEKAPAPPAVLPGVSQSPYAAPASDNRGREQEAIDLTLKQKIYDGKRTIGENARMIIDHMREKELLHAAETGERLYLPDKITWSALHEEGPRYRVYMNYVAWQANGERVMARSDQFSVDVDRKVVAPLDDGARHDFYDIAALLRHEKNPKTTDIQTMLDGVDALNRHKVRAVILKSEKKKEEQKKMLAEVQAAEDKLQRQVVYFRTKYAEKTLQNISKAFDFASTLKGK